jgi:predicted MFS family arabinose efflux permease
VNLLSAIPYGLAVLTMVLVGRAADRHGDRRWTVALPLAMAGVALLLAIAANGPLRLGLISLATASGFASLGPAWSIPLQFLGGRAAAGGIATINSVGNIGGFLAPFVMGRLMLLPQGEARALAALAAVLLLSALLAVPVAQAADRAGRISAATIP